MNLAKRRGWSGMLALSVLALVVAILALALVQGDVRAAGTFSPKVGAELSNYEHDVDADIVTSFDVPGTDYNYKVLVSFTPSEFGPDTVDVPIGTWVGEIDSVATLGLTNGACNTTLNPHFDLYWATTDSSDTVIFSEQFTDSNGDGLHDGVDKYPDFIARILPGITPLERMYGDADVSGSLVSISLVVLEAGSLGYPEAWGRPSVSILNDIGDPGAEPTPGDPITDFCTPLKTLTTIYGVSKDNPDTAANEAGHEVRLNPAWGGTYTFRWATSNMPNADTDPYENFLDTCPFLSNADVSPKVTAGHPDNDGIDGACDPDPTHPCWTGYPGSPIYTDCDGDGFWNRGDNCPLVANPGQEDDDTDDIGNACEGDVPESGDQCDNALDDDGDTRVNDGCPAVGPKETICDEDRLDCAADPDSCDDDHDGTVNDGCPVFGYGDPDKVNGTIIELTKEVDVTISGPSAEGTPTPTVVGTPTGTPGAETPTPGAETPTPTAVGGYCSPVFPGTYNGLVRINGQPAASGYQVTASIGEVQWGSAIVSGGRYAMDIPDHLPTVSPCFEGGTITFALDGMTCTPTADWASGVHDVDLSCAPAAPPVTPTQPPGTPTTPVAPPTTPTPKVTPVGPPPTGAGGLFGSSSGLPLWAMALASWAGLTTIAGLGTLVAAKRR
jgi:hypothetical protein